METPDSISDSNSGLIPRIRLSDQSAQEQIYHRAAPALHRYAHSELPGTSADDVVQEVFRRFLERPERFTERSSIETYLLGIAANVVREHRRASCRETLVPPDSMAEIAACHDLLGPLEKGELAEKLREARLALPKQQALAIALVHDSEMGARDAARVAGCTEKGLRCRLERARCKLRSALRGFAPEALAGVPAMLRCQRRWLTRWARIFVPASGALLAIAVVVHTGTRPDSAAPPRQNVASTPSISPPAVHTFDTESAADPNPEAGIEAMRPAGRRQQWVRPTDGTEFKKINESKQRFSSLIFQPGIVRGTPSGPASRDF